MFSPHSVISFYTKTHCQPAWSGKARVDKKSCYKLLGKMHDGHAFIQVPSFTTAWPIHDYFGSK